MNTQRFSFIWSAVCAALMLAAGAASGQVPQLTTLLTFTNAHGGITDVHLTQATNGLFYGTTSNGGTNNLGSVFSLDATGVATPIYQFTGGTDQSNPQTGLVQGRDNRLYGTTAGIGLSTNLGTVFELTTNGAFTTVYSFAGPDNVSSISARLTQGSDSNFYGVCASGGPAGFGQVFKVTQSGTFASLYPFIGDTNGATPVGRLVQGPDTSFYGTTTGNGTTNGGSVFKLATNGTFTLLHAFTGSSDGTAPYGSVTFASDGNLYGTTSANGTNAGGTFFRCTTNGVFTTLYSFGASGSDGKFPRAGVALGVDGQLYGTTYAGGAFGSGTVYRVTTNGVETQLYSFTGGADGARPLIGVTPSLDGSYWGSTIAGGSGQGTLFRLQLPVTITVAAAPAGGGSVGGGGTFFTGDSTTLFAYPTFGWALTNWSDGSTANPYTITVPPLNAAYTGNFALAHGTITVLANPPAGGLATGGTNGLVGSNVVIAATAAGGYTFIGWSDGVTQTPRTVVVPTNGATYYANFITPGTPTATVTLRSNPPQVGTVTGGGTYYVGSAVQVSATPAWANWVFSSWSDGNVANPRILFVPSNDVTVLANFTLTGAGTGTITLTNSPAGSATMLGSGTFSVGYPVLISATPLPGYIFIQWNDGDPNPQRYVTLAGSVTYTATNLPLMTTVATLASPSYGGSVLGAGTYRVNTNITLTATPAAGWFFVNWSDGNTNATHAITVPGGASTYAANFLPTITTALGSSGLPWVFGGAANWAGQWAINYDGIAAARSGAIGPSQSSWFKATTNGPGSLLFWWKVSSEYNHDFLSFIVDGTTNQISGNVDWTQYARFFGAGAHTFRWEYTKDASGAAGLDAGFVSDVLWLPCPPATNQPVMFFQQNSGLIASWVLSTNSIPSIQFSRFLANTGNWQLKTAGDVDGDGTSDLLFENPAGDLAVWFMNADGTTRSAHSLGNIGAWEVRACADFNADLHSEIFFQTPAGAVAYWMTDTNGNCTNSVFIGNMAPWHLQAAADLDGDHKAELFWQTATGLTAVWFHTNTTIRAQIIGNASTWALRGATDVTNGVGAIAWQTPDGNTATWLVNSNAVPTAVIPWGSTGGWQLKAVGH